MQDLIYIYIYIYIYVCMRERALVSLYISTIFEKLESVHIYIYIYIYIRYYSVQLNWSWE